METDPLLTLPTNELYEIVLLGGPAIWAIAVLSVMTLAIILWKIWHLISIGAWRHQNLEVTTRAWRAGVETADTLIIHPRSALARVVRTAIATQKAGFNPKEAEDETARVARNELASARSGLRGLELIATIAPLIGLLGTVLGMIEAFQTLQSSGARADPADLAGGIWEALLTTAAGMTVAIPASAALTWFESVNDKLRLSMEDMSTRILTRPTTRED